MNLNNRKYLKIEENKYGIDTDDILKQVNDEYKQGLESVELKRREREKDLQNKYVPLTKDDKLNIHSIYTAVQTLMSVYYADRMDVEFAPRRQTLISKASQINKLADFDYDEMGLDKIDYEWNWDRFFFGVGIKVLDAWDKERQTPVPRVMNPLSWIPDPRGGFDATKHRWAGFEIENTKASMKNNPSFFNIELVNNASYSKQDEIYQAYKNGRGILNDYVDQTPNKKFAIYNHYTCIDGKKYLVTTANHGTLVIRMEELEAVTKAEKRDYSKIPFPIALKYFSPMKGDPLGISVPDLLRDKQNAESKLFNLTLISATRNALGDDKIYNPKKIKNVKDLQKPTVGGKYIPANIHEGENLGSVIMTIPKENPTNLPFDIQNQIRFQTSISTGMDSNTLGIQSSGSQTATEAQITQKNANLRFILGNKIGKWGEEVFWRLWYRSYIYNLPQRQKKFIRVAQGFEDRFFEIGRKDFITIQNIDIKIISKSEKESLRNKEKLDFYSIAPQFLQDPALPKISKTYTKRKMYRLMGLAEEEVMRLIPKTLDERLAELDVELVNNGQEASPVRQGQDHLTFIDILDRADDNEFKAKAIADREQAYIEEGQAQVEEILNQQEAQGDNTAGNIAQSNASSRMSSNMIKEAQGEKTPSLENVT